MASGSVAVIMIRHPLTGSRFYNTTYTVFAASVIVVYIMKEATEVEMDSLLRLVGMAIEILETMDDCVVALKASRLLQRAMERAKRKFSRGAEPSPAAAAAATAAVEANESMLHLNHYWGPLNLIDADMDLDFAFQVDNMNGTESIFGPL